MWSEEEQREITDYELGLATVRCPACSSSQKKYRRTVNQGGFPVVARVEYCQNCGHALD